MANFTEEAIKNKFMELLNRKPINKITVKEIAAECEINRNSFYYHFNDLPSLLEVILTDEAERFVEMHNEAGSIYEHLLDAIDFAIENKTAVYHIYNSANREMFEHYLDRISTKTVSDYMDNATRDMNIGGGKFVAPLCFFTSGFLWSFLAGGGRRKKSSMGGTPFPNWEAFGGRNAHGGCPGGRGPPNKIIQKKIYG